MSSGLLIILTPLIVGYLVPFRQQVTLKIINQLLSWMAYPILFFMGISLAFLNNLASNLLTILYYSTISITIILLCSIATLMWLERGLPWCNHHQQEKLPSYIVIVLESLEPCGVVVIGFVIDLSGLAFLRHVTEASKYASILPLLLAGIQLRNNSMTLKQIILGRRGTIIAVIVVISPLISGLISALILDLPTSTALAMASGFSWYSLPGVLLTESFDSVIGSTTFFNDLVHELIATILIPGLIRRSRSTALGLCGVISMDFILPVLQRIGGPDMVSAAIVYGSIFSPLVSTLIASFSA